MGPELIENMRKQAQKFGTEFKAGAVSEVDVSSAHSKLPPEKIPTKRKRSSLPPVLPRASWPKGEKELIGHGVSTCATCDGYFFRASLSPSSAAVIPR